MKNKEFSIISVNYIGDGLRDAFDPYKVLETVGGVYLMVKQHAQ